jgi:glycosyltransferase involved in cell wall biosynthesis
VTTNPPGHSRPSLLFVATVSSTVGHFLTPYATHLRELGWRVDTASSGATTDEGLRDVFDHRYELPLSRSLLDPVAMLGGYRAMAHLLRETEYDLVHVHTPIASFVARLAVRRMPPQRRPAVVYTAHGFHFRKGGHPIANAVFAIAERLAGRWIDRLVVINDEDEAAARRHRILPTRHLVRMPGIGVDTAWYSPSHVASEEAAAARTRLGIPVDAPVFVVVGELSKRKRQADAIAALAAMQHRDARLVLLGDGPTRPRLVTLVRRLGIVDRVVFAGEVNDVRPYLVMATGFVLNSDREGLARAVMEALALEVPVAVSNARGNEELVGESGFLLRIGDVDALAGALDWLVDHQEERRLMGQHGRERMVERYDLQIVIGLHDRLYDELLAERAMAATSGGGS